MFGSVGVGLNFLAELVGFLEGLGGVEGFVKGDVGLSEVAPGFRAIRRERG
jgi:hypothetical protein